MRVRLAVADRGGTRRISPLGRLLVAVRIVALAAALAVHVAAYYALAPFVRRNPVPRVFLRSVAAIAGLRIRVSGRKAPGRVFLLSNHVSWLDTPALAGITGTAFVAHDGLAALGALRWLCELNDTVFIARHDRASVARQVEQVRTALDEVGTLAIFPEGTTSDGTGTLPFKSSLLSALEAAGPQLQVQPVWLDYGPRVADMAWVGDEPGLANALRILARWRPLRLTMHLLPPLSGEDRTDRKRIAAAAQAAIRDAMAAAQADRR